MYFSIILLFLLTSKFTNSMESQQVQSASHSGQMELMEMGLQSAPGSLIPFTLPYTNEAKLLLDKIKKRFYISITGKIRLKLQPKDLSDDGSCVVQDGHLVDDTPCVRKYVQHNEEYIDFANKSIWLILKKLFNNPSSHHIKLNPNNSNTGSCIPRNIKFVCVYKPNYQITISSSLMNIVQNVLEKLRADNETQITDEFYISALIFILKFHPFTAPLYLAYLYRKFVILNESQNWQDYYFYNRNNQNMNVVQVNDDSMVQYTETQSELDKKIFDVVTRKVPSCDLNKITTEYLFHKEYILWTFVFCIAAVSIAGVVYH